MRKLIFTIATLLFAISLSACSDHGHEHDENNDHGHDAPKHHNSID